MSLAIDDFKARLTGGGARANLFRARINFPAFITNINTETVSFLCKTANLPASNISEIAVPFRGRPMNLAGERTFEPWTITIINDTDFAIRNAFESWVDRMGNATQAAGEANPNVYKVNMGVDQLDRGGQPIKSYEFIGVFPSAVAEISLGYEEEGIEEFEVTLQIDYFTSDTTT